MNANIGMLDDFAQAPLNHQTNSVRASELLSRGIEEIPMLFAPIFPKQGLALLAGASDSGKSMLLRNMAICVATGRDYLGWKNNAIYKSCIFVATEDDERATSFLLNRHNKTLRLPNEAYKGLRFLFQSDNIEAELDNELAAEPADLVIIDAYSDVFDGKEQNSAAQTRAFIRKFKDLSAKHHCLIVFLHHTNKKAEELAPSKNNLVGSQSLEASVRLAIEVRTDKENSNLRHFCIVKGNYLGAEFKNSSFVLNMDENFIFQRNGDSVAFEELGSVHNVTGRTKKKPEDYSDNIHVGFIGSLSFPLSKNELNKEVEKYYSVSDKTARTFVTFLENRNFVHKNDEKPYPKYVN